MIRTSMIFLSLCYTIFARKRWTLVEKYA